MSIKKKVLTLDINKIVLDGKLPIPFYNSLIVEVIEDNSDYLYISPFYSQISFIDARCDFVISRVYDLF